MACTIMLMASSSSLISSLGMRLSNFLIVELSISPPGERMYENSHSFSYRENSGRR
jgi:hypothetical protein